MGHLATSQTGEQRFSGSLGQGSKWASESVEVGGRSHPMLAVARAIYVPSLSPDFLT